MRLASEIALCLVRHRDLPLRHRLARVRHRRGGLSRRQRAGDAHTPVAAPSGRARSFATATMCGAVMDDIEAAARRQPARFRPRPAGYDWPLGLAAPRPTRSREKIPAGATLTYGEIAERLGDRLLARDVGEALGQNPFPIIVPCHRVLAAGKQNRRVFRARGRLAPSSGSWKSRARSPGGLTFYSPICR